MPWKMHFNGLFNGERAVAAGRSIPIHYDVEFVPHPDEPGPAAHFWFEVIDGVPQCVELRLTKSAHGREIRRSDYEDIPIERILESATQYVAQPVKAVQEDAATGRTDFILDATGLDKYLSDLRKTRRTAYKRGPDDQLLREVGEIYTSANPKAPTKAVSEHFDIAQRTASLWVKQAREKGFVE